MPEIRKETLATFEAQMQRIKRVAQEGMARVEDLPSTSNFNEAKRKLGLTVKADMKRAMDIIGDAMEDLLNGIESIFSDSLNVNGSEMGALDVVMGRKIILHFTKSLSSSEEGLLRMVEELRVWTCLAPIIKRDKLNALIQTLKDLESPVTAGTVMTLVKEGIPTRMDDFIDYVVELVVKDLGDLETITISPWKALSSKSIFEISSTSLVNPEPLQTSSKTDTQVEVARNDASTRLTLDKLKTRFRNASSALNK